MRRFICDSLANGDEPLIAIASYMPKHPPIIIYYNTLCPVCRAGIDWQKGLLMPLVKTGEVEFRDINEEPDRLAEFGSNVEDVRKKLHALVGDNLLIGAPVAVEIWRRTPGQGWLAAIFGNPIILPLTKAGYHILAHVLYFWNRKRGNW